MAAQDFFYSLLQQADAQGSKSSVMRTITSLLGLELAALAFVVRAERAPPEWLLIVLVTFLGVTLAVCFFGFIWSLIKKPDLLRSERFNIRKLEIEQLGDSQNGLRSRDDEPLGSIQGQTLVSLPRGAPSLDDGAKRIDVIVDPVEAPVPVKGKKP